MIVLDIYEADDFGAADKVERIEGTYNGKAFELDRVYSDYNEEDDTYGLIEVEWYDGDSSLKDEELEDTIIERFWDMDYDETEFKLPSEQDENDQSKQKIEEIDKFSLAEKIALFLLIVTERSDGNLHKDEWKFVENNLVIKDSKTTDLINHPSLLDIIDLTSKTTIISSKEIKQHGKQILETLLSQSQFDKFKKWYDQNWDVYFEKHEINFMEFFGAEIIPYYEPLFSSLNMTFKKWVYTLLIELLKVEDAGEENNQTKQGWAQGLPGDIGLGDVKIKFTGSKTVNYEGGASYSGEFVNDLCHGKGTYTHADGSSYSGEFAKDLMHGKGIYKWASGGKFEGVFVNGKQKGKGIYFWPDGSSYFDNWEDGIHNAEGTYTDVKHKKYHNIYSVYIKSVEETKKILQDSNIKLDFNFKSKLLNNLSAPKFVKSIIIDHNKEDSISKIINNILKSESIGSELISKIAKRSDLDNTNQEIVNLKMRISQLKEENKESKNYVWLEDSLLSIKGWGSYVFEALYKDEDVHIRSAVAKNPSLPPNLLTELAKDNNSLIKVSVLSNPSCNKTVLTLASEDTGNYSSSRVRKTVALNSGTPKVVIDKLIIDEHRWVREAAASHPTIDKQKIDELIKTGDRYLLKGLGSNPNCTKTTKININSLLKDEEKYPLHWIETVESHKMDGVPVHPKRFWLELGSKATTAEWLYDKIYDGDGGYTDIDIDEWNEDEDLGEVGYAYYLWVDCPKYTNTNAAFFQVNVYLPNQEATDIYIVPLDDVISDLIEKNYREEIEDLFERYPWIADVINEEDVYKK